jgi:RNA polymerase sigma-70 factor (ECF subfamily)
MAEVQHEEFLKLYQPIHSRFVKYCSNHAYGLMETEDLVQEAVLSTLQRFHLIREKEKLLGYLFATANNIVRNHIRRKKFSGKLSEYGFSKIEASGVDAETAMDIHHLHLALNKLPVKDKEAILLFEISGFSIEEIAVIQESSAGATKTRLSRAREKLRGLMEDEFSPAKKNTKTLFMLL